MREIILATRNAGKLKEFQAAFSPEGISVVGLTEMEGAPDVVEDGETFADNALIKATVVSSWSGKPVLADDSGIIIDSLPGEFGVKSARQVGNRPYSEVNADILKRLEGVTGNARSARYVAALAYVDVASNHKLVVEGTFEGFIHTAITGTGGFGFDPIFYLPEKGKTVAEIPLEEKGRISHRGKAIALMKQRLSG